MREPKVKYPIQPGDGDRRHGSLNGYNNHACPCELCHAGMLLYFRRARKTNGKMKPLQDNDSRHGTPGGYDYHGCRCPRCSAANAAKRREERAP